MVINVSCIEKHPHYVWEHSSAGCALTIRAADIESEEDAPAAGGAVAGAALFLNLEEGRLRNQGLDLAQLCDKRGHTTPRSTSCLTAGNADPTWPICVPQD